MPTYIDKDKLMNEFIEFVAPSNRDSSLPIPTWNDAVSLLGSAPDADVVEVKHGEWVYNIGYAFGEKPYFCSLCVCGESDNARDNFCPNCGADMRGETE